MSKDTSIALTVAGIWLAVGLVAFSPAADSVVAVAGYAFLATLAAVIFL